ncbi:MAG: prolyl oligopeptidase family serine peptidase [Muribaculaceae bacterium]|nr:prolyl oligopeptidase family serine peptidase [Muribaculaceae bacterium]
MINKLTAALAASAVAFSFLGVRGDSASVKFDIFKVSPETSLLLPAVPGDSVLAAKNAFSNDKLLKSVNRKLDKPSADWTEVKTDTAFSVHFPKSENGPVLRTLATRMRPDRFLKGTLRLKSNVMAELSDAYGSLLTISQADSVPSWDKTNMTIEPGETADLFISFISFPDDPDAPCIELEFEPDEGFESVAIATGPATTTRFRVDESALGTRVSGASISPDGKYMILSYSTMYGENNHRAWSELLECSTGKTLNASLPRGAFWLPKGSTLAYTVKTDKTYSLYSLDAATQKQTLMASELPEDSFTISPDCSFLIIYKYVEGPKDAGPVKLLREPDDRLAGHRNRYYLEKYDLKTGIRQPITYGGNTTTVYDISPDSRKLVYGSQTEKMDAFPFYFNDVIELDLNTLATDTLVKGDPYVQSCIYSPDGKQLFFTGGPEAFAGIGKNNGGHKYSNDYDVQGYIMTIVDKSVRPMTRDFNPSLEGYPIWNSVDGQVYFRASAGFTLNVYKMDPKSGNITKLDFGMPYISRFSIGSDENKWMSAVGSDYHYAGRCELMDLKSGKLRVVDDPYSRDYPDMQTGESSSWSYKAPDGTTIDCMQVLPPDFDSNKKYPLIVYYYGGCSPCQRYLSVYDPQIFASRGYVTLVINPSGAYGYGQEFSARHANAWGDYTADDIIEGVKEYCRTHDFVNDKKIGCLGASYGGFMTEYLQTKTDIFAAAASHAGISNVTSYWGEGNWGYSYNTVAAPESYPWTNPDLFTKHGALFNADKIHTPLLLLHGSVDTNVPIGESIQLFNALRILGRDVEFVQVDGENHIITNHDKRKPWHATIMAWFAKHLQDDPSWWDSLYGD